MNLPKYMATNPITDEHGVVWDRYWLVNLVVSTDVVQGKPSLLAEFWPCRTVSEPAVVDGQVTMIDRTVIKTGLRGDEVKHVVVDDLFVATGSNGAADQVMMGLLTILGQFGVQAGFMSGQ